MNLLLNLLRLLVRPLRGVWRWITADWRHAMLAWFAVLLAVHIFIIDPSLRGQIEAAQKALTLERAAHQGTIADYQQAAAEAARRDAANVARVKNEQAAITQEIVDVYQDRIADARARAARLADSLRAQTPANSGSGAATAVPGISGTAGGTDAAPGQGGLSAPDALIATEQAIQLDALIDWVEAQARVNVNGEPDQ